ncbi:MAG TPA: hypothetical protein VLB12_11200 [Gemmatimonadales bacterium]|nr:hypothetical protein [Gemmatimonadales bacterium]
MNSRNGELLWRDVPAPLRGLARWLTIVQVVGYTTALLFVLHTTKMVPSGISERYRGSDSTAVEEAMQFPKSYAEMLTLTHTHILSMAVIFAFSGLGVALCSRLSPRLKRFLIVEPFVALLVSFSCLWLVRYVDPRFSWLLALSSTIMAITFYVQSFLILTELHLVEQK